MDLSKNNSSMKTVVETFIVEEVEELIYDNEKLAEWNGYIEQLGLAGQQSICKPEKSPIPFLFANESLVKVFETLCPRKVNVKDFNTTPIPVEILSLIALAVKENYFQKIEIWYDEKTPDPVCIAKVCKFYTYDKDGNQTPDFDTYEEAKAVKHPTSWSVYEKNVRHYLIGKWADMKYSFEELRQKAIERYMKTEKAQIMQRITDAQKELESLENECVRLFG